MRRVRCYDNGGLTADRYTVVWLRPEVIRGSMFWTVASMSTNPTHPQGVWGTSELRCLPYYGDCPEIGKRIPFRKLPKVCQDLVANYWED